MEADWDLLAVVRGCSSTTATSLKVADHHQNLPPPPPPPPQQQPNPPACFNGGCEDLQDLYKPFFPANPKPPISAPPPFGGKFMMREQLKLLQQRPQHEILFQPQVVKDSHQLIFGSTGIGSTVIPSQQTQRMSTTLTPTTTPQTQQRPKKRKNLQKKVCHLPVEGLSSDMWAWRKYGQKPIKGSPYPRGYYKCSSSKGCPARKQVERNRSNPKMFIVTYTSEHNHPIPTHRNSLAGSTRHKPATAGTDSHPAASSSPTASPSTEKGEIKTEEEDMGIDYGNEKEFFPDMVLDDDFLAGFEELDDMDGGDGVCEEIRAPLAGVDFLDEHDWELGLLHS